MHPQRRQKSSPPAPGTVGHRIQEIRYLLSDPGMRLALEDFGRLITPHDEEPPSASTVGRWEHNDYEPSIGYLVAIARLDPQKRGLCWLLTGEPCAHEELPEPMQRSRGPRPVANGPR